MYTIFFENPEGKKDTTREELGVDGKINYNGV
jgi:hypothetical protein